MPFSVEFDTRHYELDSFRHVNNANYLRWCEHARVEWFRAAGYDIEALKDAGLLLVVTATDSVFRKPLPHSRRVRMSVAATATRRTSGALVQILTDVPSGREAFRCFVDWAIIGDRHNAAAKACLEDFKRMIAANQENDPPLPKHRGDAAWRLPVRTHATKLTAQAYDLDSFAHVNNAVYASYLEAGRWGFFVKMGLLKERLRAAKSDGFEMILARQRIEYAAAAGLLEPLKIVSGIHDVGRARFIVRQEIRHAKSGLLYTRGEAEICGVDVKTGRPAALPRTVAAKLRLWAEATTSEGAIEPSSN